jgi:hypothetical protein
MSRQEARCLTRRTELKHCGQRRFEDDFFLHTTTANRRKLGKRFEEMARTQRINKILSRFRGGQVAPQGVSVERLRTVNCHKRL